MKKVIKWNSTYNRIEGGFFGDENYNKRSFQYSIIKSWRRYKKAIII